MPISSILRRSTLPAALVFGLFSVALVAPSRAAVTWVRFEDPTCVDEGNRASDYVLQCGSFGSFVFDNTEARLGSPLEGSLARLLARSRSRAGDQCTPEANGREIPPVVIDQPVPAGVNWEPCPEGDCFLDPALAPPGPWVAVVDWQTLHGRSVAHTLLQASPAAFGLRLFDLADPGVREIASLEQIGDAHILAQLCGVAQVALEQPPLAINMSFGRMHDPSRPACTPQDGELRCQIEALVDHLHTRYGVRSFAAAGNHGELTFPAAAPGVLSVGSLDLGQFWPSGDRVAAEQSPAEADLLFPGYGLVLEGAAAGEVWPVPPGSSYASAVATGWLAGYALTTPDYDLTMSLLVSSARADQLGPEIVGTELALRSGGSVLSGSVSPGATRLTNVALGFVPGIFSDVSRQSPADPGSVPSSFAFRLQPSAAVVVSDAPSLTALNGTVARPSPDSEPCVPCRLGSRRRRAAESDWETVVELGGSGGVPAGSQLLDVLFEVGALRVEPPEEGQIEELSPTLLRLSGADYQQALASGYFEFLDGLERGDVVELVLEGLPALSGRTLSVRYELIRDDGELYWDSTPIANHLDVAPLLFSDSFDLGEASAWSAAVADPDL